MKVHKPIILCGYTSSGKTTIGSLLAKKLKLDFYDTDQMLTEQNHMSIPEIFSKGGEELFRELERRIISQVCLLGPSVISTGGGMLASEKNALLLSRHGLILYIERPFEACYQSLALHPQRPLFQKHTKEQLAEIYEKRTETYRRYASLTIENNSTPEAAVDFACRFLEL